MKRFFLLLIAAFTATVPLQAQEASDPVLARAMDSIFKRDQQYRSLLYAIDTNRVIKDSIARAARVPADSVFEYLVEK